ncbi:hypothetical protein L7F22_041817 [Adiantum nelumboides]|nr:hypothetical protein [Adiantum nelumboides]
MTELEALCHSTIDEDDELKRWAGLVSTPQNDNGKDSKNEEIDEPLDAEADAILELLQETGQQDIAIEDVSCEVIGTKDVQAIETTEKDPLNPHLNQIVYKDDDKETQASEESRITRPNNLGVEAFFKSLAIASTKFGIDLKRLLLIDDAPLKGCINLALNFIFPPSFNIDKEDNILLGELLPYTKALHHVNDIRIIAGSSLYGQAPIVQGHDLYNHVQKVVIEWEERNLVCLQKTYSTSRLPEAPRVLDDENGASSSTTGMSTRSQDKK